MKLFALVLAVAMLALAGCVEISAGPEVVGLTPTPTLSNGVPPQPQPVWECRELAWMDNTTNQCVSKEFCDNFTDGGAYTFEQSLQDCEDNLFKESQEVS